MGADSTVPDNHSKMKTVIAFFITTTLITLSDTNICTVTRTAYEVKTDCSSKGLERIPYDIPVNTTVLDLSFNNLKLISNYSFVKFSCLRSISLKASNIFWIENRGFDGLHMLDTLDLSKNQFRNYPEEALKRLSNLQILKINGLFNSELGNGFGSLHKLQQLYFEPCHFRILKNNTFIVLKDKPIKRLELKCELRLIENGALRPFQSIDVLEIHENFHLHIPTLLPILHGLAGLNITKLNFKSNYKVSGAVDVISASEFAMLGILCVKEVDLSENHITIIKAGAIFQMKYKNCLEKLVLSHNGIRGEFSLLFELPLLVNIKIFDFSHQDLLRLPKNNDTETKVQANKVSSVTQFVLTLPKSLQLLDVSYIGGHNNELPEFSLKNADSLTILNANYNYFKNCLGYIKGLHNLHTFGMSGFGCKKINFEMIRSMTNLQYLESKDAHLGEGLNHDIDGKFLKGLDLLTVIDFSGNEFKSLNLNMFRSQHTSLNSLILSNNKFTDIPISVHQFVHLTTLDLVDNHIAYLSDESIRALETYQTNTGIKLQLLLNNQHMVCTCESLQFIKWLQETQLNIDNNRNYSCLYLDNSKKTTIYAYKHLKYMEQKCLSKLWVIISISLSLFFLVILIGSCVAYKYRVTLHYWYLNIRRKHRNYITLDGYQNEYRYDAFVAYSSVDYPWVCGPFLNFMEKENGFTLCLNDRDFSAGKLIMDNIMDAISKSKKVILIVSNAFLESSWCEFELDMARMQMVQENRDMIIVIVLDPIPTKQMPHSLVKIWTKITCLEADLLIRNAKSADSRHLFWMRLYDAMKI